VYYESATKRKVGKIAGIMIAIVLWNNISGQGPAGISDLTTTMSLNADFLVLFAQGMAWQ
jgi:hypothetical protein